jgi:hypothetical protein
MDMNTTVLLVRMLMLVGMISPLVIAAVVVAIREKRRASNLDGDASPNPHRPIVIRTVIATRRITRRGKRIIARLLPQEQSGTRPDAVRAQPWT